MPRPAPDPLAGTDRLLLDGSNLLHALGRGAGPLPATALIGRLRGAVPARTGIELILDGPPEPGMHNTRIASGLIVRYSGRRSADELLESLVDEVGAGGARASLDNILVVTDDRELRQRFQRRGVRTAGTRWLIGRLERERLEAPSTGNRRPAAPARHASTGTADPADDAPDEPPRWRPGRGATRKRGNARRQPRPPRG